MGYRSFILFVAFLLFALGRSFRRLATPSTIAARSISVYRAAFDSRSWLRSCLSSGCLSPWRTAWRKVVLASRP